MPATHTQGESVYVPTRDGRHLHAKVLTAQRPAAPANFAEQAATVVFEAGVAADRSTWARVQPSVAEHARAVVYDRSGLGRSAPDPEGRTLSRMAADLNEVLDHAAPGPVVLVGHSAGGLIVRRAAAERPDRIAGLLLVDPFDEAADVVFSTSYRRMSWIAPRVAGLLARTGLLPRLHQQLLASMPEDVRAELRREGFTAQAMATWTSTNRTLFDELAGWRTARPDLQHLPLTVISGTRPGDGMNRATRAAANAGHAQRAACCPEGRQVLAEQSAHNVPLTEPGLIVNEVLRLL